MPVLLLIVPAALVTQAPSPAPGPVQALDPLQGQLRSIPAAFVGGKAGTMKGLVTQAKAAWEKARPSVRKLMPEAEATFIDKQLKAMKTMSPREQAVGALGISNSLSRYQPRSRQQELLQAERTAMMAFCSVDAGLWQPMPNVAEAFKPVLDKDKGAHTVAAIAAQDALKRFQDSQAKKQAPLAKKALKDLLDLVATFAQP